MCFVKLSTLPLSIIQSTQEDSSVHEHRNFCALSDSETNRKSFPFKEELEAFKAQVISEIKPNP